HFPVRWMLGRSPLFLYPLTVAYFATYFVVLQIGWRAFVSAWPRLPAIGRLAVLCGLGYAVAFAESACMATDCMRPFFSYRDRRFMLAWGSLFYGTVFVVSLPLLFPVDESPSEPRRSLARVALDACAANTIILCAYAVYARLVAHLR